MVSLARHAAALAIAALLAPLVALAQQQGPTGPGYDVQRSQTVQQAPAGWVGRKTTDREQRIGKTAETQGHHSTFVMTIGGFAKACPSAEGIVEGNFEYLLTYDEERNAGGAALRSRVFRHFVARLKGHVGDDARLREVELEGTYTTARDILGETPSSDQRQVRTTFRPGAGGAPDYEAMRSVAGMASDVAIANVILMGGTLYQSAELNWLKENACVEFRFDPPSDTRALGASQNAPVRIELRSKESATAAAFKTEHIRRLEEGSVAPRSVEAALGASASITYTASAKPKRGHGFEIATLSRAGLGSGKWRIIERARYEGRFTQTDSATLGSGLGSGTDTQKVTGTLVWTPDDAPKSKPTFGDVPSSFYKVSGGDISIEMDYVFQGLGGSKCEQRGRDTFALASLPEALLQYLQLEIAQDGRYRLSLGLPDRVWSVWKMEVEAVCTFPGGQVRRERVSVNQVAVQIGVRQGTLTAEEGVAGELTPPIRRGPRTITGNWSFSKKTD
jgi:hypothetical protein